MYVYSGDFEKTFTRQWPYAGASTITACRNVASTISAYDKVESTISGCSYMQQGDKHNFRLRLQAARWRVEFLYTIRRWP